MTIGAPCAVCTGLVRLGRHEPFLVDDVPTWTRLWRCSRCGTLWMEGDRVASPISETDTDEQVPGWRERANWLAVTTVPGLLTAYRSGRLGADLFGLALLHHEALTARAGAADPESVVLFSSADSARVAGQGLAALHWDSIARSLRWTSGRHQVLVDPGSPWQGFLDPYVVEYLDANGRRTVTELDRARGVADDAQ